jgi:hypothetical protein
MIDVNKITSTLAKLPDQQLQQYAQMHKNDPYIMALAMSESNRRKEMRAAGQGGQAPQEQPKVVDQMVAEMASQQLPEEMGIGQLPAGDMNFADGGIVAFAGGGDVERFNGTQSQFVQDVAEIPGKYNKWWQENRESDRIKAERERALAQRQQEELAARQKTSFANYLFGSPEREAEGKSELARLAATPVGASARSGTMPEKGYTRPGMLYDPRLNTPASVPLSASGAAPLTAPTADTGPKAPGPSVSNATLAGGLAALDPNKLYATALEKAGKEERPEKGMLEKLNAARGAAAEEELAGTKALNEKFADAFKGRRERLESREGELGTMKDQNLGLALLQAGAAMMSTPGRLGAAIGKGIQSGSQQYVAGIDKLNAAKDKLADARDRLDDLQLNRDEMSAREILKAENKIRDTALSGQENMIKFVMDRDKVDRDTAMKVVDNQIKLGITQIEQQGQNTRSAAQIAASARNPQLELLEAVNKDPKLAAAYQSMHGKGEDVMGQYNDFLKANPALAMDPKAAVTQFLMTKSVFSQIGKPTVTDKPSTNVRTQP